MLAQALPDHPEHADTITRVLAIRSRRRPAPTVEFLTTGETEVLLAAPDTSTWTGRRDQALLALAVQTGLRISELITLTCHDIHTATGAHVTCLGKGRRRRATPLTATTLTVLHPYLAERATRPGDAPVPSPRRSPPLPRRPRTPPCQTPRHRRRDLPSLQRQARDNAHAAPHRRHAAAREAGVDVSVIALWLGHQHTNSTDVYLHADMTIKQTAIDRTRPPHIPAGTYTPPPDILTWLDKL